MPESDASHVDKPRRSGALLRRTTAGLVAVVLAAAVASYRFDLGERLDVAVAETVKVPPPAGLDLPESVAASPVADEAAVLSADPAAVRRAVAGLAHAKKLGRRVAVAVAEPGSGATVYADGASAVTPASTMKLLSSLAALEALGPDHRFSTTVARAGKRIVLVGGGDPLLASRPADDDSYPKRADVTTLARQTAAALASEGVSKVRLGYDTSLFTGPSVEPTWEPDYVADNVVSPITSLWVEQGREREGYAARSADPALAAAQVFAAELGKKGIAVAGPPQPRTAGAGMTQIAEVHGAPLTQVVQHTLEVSDNEASEVLARHVAIASGREASFDGGAAAVSDVLARLGVDLTGAVIHDGSGLSRADRLGPGTLLDVLQVAATDPDLRTVVSGLPVSGFSGSLALRFQKAPRVALGEVRAKTGTLTGVNGLAGTVMTRDGVLLTFVVIADKVRPENTLFARDQLDRIAGALAACACSAG